MNTRERVFISTVQNNCELSGLKTVEHYSLTALWVENQTQDPVGSGEDSALLWRLRGGQCLSPALQGACAGSQAVLGSSCSSLSAALGCKHLTSSSADCSLRAIVTSASLPRRPTSEPCSVGLDTRPGSSPQQKAYASVPPARQKPTGFARYLLFLLPHSKLQSLIVLQTAGPVGPLAVALLKQL